MKTLFGTSSTQLVVNNVLVEGTSLGLEKMVDLQMRCVGEIPSTPDTFHLKFYGQRTVKLGFEEKLVLLIGAQPVPVHMVTNSDSAIENKDFNLVVTDVLGNHYLTAA